MFRQFLPVAALASTLLVAPAQAGQPTFYPRDGGYPFSEAVQAGDILYISGIIPESADGKAVTGGIEDQGQQVMAQLGQVLAHRDLDFDDVIQCTVYLADMKDWPGFNAVYRTSFKPGHYPARAALGASGLALGARVELQCNAWNPAKKQGH